MLLETECSSLHLFLIWCLIAPYALMPSAAFQVPFNFETRSCPPGYDESPVILVSTDGFRADYLERGLTPTIARLYKEGVSAPYIKPSYPAITFPNHYTIATGLLPPYHGVVANKFFAPEFNATFRVGRKEYFQQRFWGGEPIWKTVENQGKLSATYFWPGSEIVGLRPTYWKSYNESHPFEDRVKQVLTWLDLPSGRRPSFITLYMHDPDDQGHKHGPDSPQVNDALRRVDATVSQLVQGLERRNLLSCVNLIILADHGMAAAGKKRVINVQQIIPEVSNRTTRYWNGVFPRFEPLDGSQGTTQNMINRLSCKKKEMRVYHKHQLPIRWHLGAQRRVEDIVLDLDSGYQVDFDGKYIKKADEGDHGYDYIFHSMNALFLAHGPAFRKFTEVESFQNIEIYNLICALLHIQPAPNNGTWGALHHLLVNPPNVEDLKVNDLPSFALLPPHSDDDDDLKVRRKLSRCSSKKLYSRTWESVQTATEEFSQELLEIHLPWGVPQLQDDTLSVKLLFQFDHITAFSERLKMPLWTAFHYESNEGTPPQKWLDDFRISPDRLNEPCNRNNLPAQYSWEPLFHPFFSREDQESKIPFLSSNAVPISSFLSKKWGELRTLIDDWREGYEGINVIIGTVFDYNNDTLVDSFASLSARANGQYPIIPTHLYAVVTRCLGGGGLFCTPDWLDALAFVFPQSLAASNCMPFENFAREFTAKIDDVEKISGLQFYPHLKFENRVALKIRLHSNLWGKEIWKNRLKSDTFGLKR